MKKRVVKYVAGACVAGMVLSTSGVGMAVAATPEEGSWSAAENENVDLYGPPSVFEGIEDPIIDEPIQVFYGPAPIIDGKINPMTVVTHNKQVTQSALETGKKVFPKAITVKNAIGKVRFEKVDDESSKRLAVNKKTGAIAVKKGTKAGTYMITVVVSASGNDDYLSAYELATVKVRVK